MPTLELSISQAWFDRAAPAIQDLLQELNRTEDAVFRRISENIIGKPLSEMSAAEKGQAFFYHNIWRVVYSYEVEQAKSAVQAAAEAARDDFNG